MPSPDRQLLLKLRPEGEPTLSNFVVGSNGELLERLQMFGADDQIYLWGTPGSGRSHLLTAVARRGSDRPVRQVAAADIGDHLDIEPGSLLVIDDVQNLSPEAQVSLFRVFIAARENSIALMLSGALPPLQLGLREDLRSRIGQMLIYEIKGLSDDEKSAALRQYARQRGLPVDDSVLRHLLQHGRRDLPSLLAMIDRLDELSLSLQRPATLPLLRQLMQTP